MNRVLQQTTTNAILDGVAKAENLGVIGKNVAALFIKESLDNAGISLQFREKAFLRPTSLARARENLITISCEDD